MEHLIRALLQDITQHVQHGTALPKAFSGISKTMDLHVLQQGVWELLHLHERTRKSPSLLTQAVATYMCTDIASAFDTRDSEVLGDMKHTATYMKSLQSWSIRKQEGLLQRMVQLLTPHSPLIIVETALTLDAEHKAMFRRDLISQYETCFPMFRTNSGILGGVRLYINGTLTEYSLRAELDAIFAHLYLNV